MKQINDENGASDITAKYATKLIEEIKDKPLIGAELGVAYGGGVERIGKLWKDCGGTIYGFDTFTGHPKHLGTSPNAHETYCMDYQHDHNPIESVSYEFQRKILDEQGLDNVILCKGLLNAYSLDHIPYLHYALLDLDLIVSMTLAWTLVRHKMVPGGYLCLHDVVPLGHIDGLWGLYQEILAWGGFKLIEEIPASFIAVLQCSSPALKRVFSYHRQNCQK